MRFPGDLLPGGIEIEAEMVGQVLQELCVVPGVAFLLPRFDGFTQGALGIGNDEVRIETALDGRVRRRRDRRRLDY